MKKIIYIIALLLTASVALVAQSPKGKTGTFALTNANIETVTKGVITNGTIIISIIHNWGKKIDRLDECEIFANEIDSRIVGGIEPDEEVGIRWLLG